MSSALLGLWRRWLLILTLAAAAAGAVAAYSFTAAKHYKATAVLVVSPVSVSDPTFLGVDVFRESQRRAAAETAARLIRSPEVAESVRVRLGLHRTATDLLDDVSTRVLGGSDAVGVTASDTAPARAAQLANAFVSAFVAARTAAFQSEIVSAVDRLQRRLVAMSPNERVGPAGAQLQRRLADTRALVSMRDPTVSAGSQAVQPSSASWPKPAQWTIFAALAGLAAGCLVALGLALTAALRRREPLDAGARSPEVSERLAGQLERRLSERLGALADEQMRLAERKAEVEMRERELTAELEGLQAVKAEPADVDTSEIEELERREEILAARVKSVEQRERELARRGAELQRAEAALDDRQAIADRREEERGATEADVAGRREELDADVARRLEELDGAEADVARRREELDGREADAARRGEELDRREADLGRRREELDGREADAARRWEELEGREADAARRREELEGREAALATLEEQLGAREASLAAREEDVRRAETRLVQDRAATAARENELDARASELAVQEPMPAQPILAVTPAETPAAPWLPAETASSSAVYARGGWRLEELERLVERESPANPDRVDEWRSYLFYLRDYTDASGRVPSRFDWLIEDAFGDLLARR